MPTNSNEFANVVLRYEDGTIVKGIAELNDITSYLDEHKEEFARVRHGRWKTVDKGHYFYDWECSVCGGSGRADYFFCPNCGGRMDLEGDAE